MIIKTIKVSNSKDYSEDLIDALVKAHSPEFLLRRTQWTHFYIALDGTTIIGCGAIGPYWDSETESSLFTIFVMPEYQKCGA
jgi:N-acetylglutamate synthase-like GNAT family acetyltransferase